MVIEGLVVQAIKLAAGSYIKDIDPSQLTTSLWNGSVQLERIELKPNAFDQFNLPFRIQRGFAENVKIVVPISNLYEGKWEVEIGGLYLSASPITSFKYDHDTVEREAFEVKERLLLKVENDKAKAALEREGKEESKGFFGGAKEFIVAHLLKVVEIRVGNVHVRYEDAVSQPEHPFACGLTLEGLYVQSTNGLWKVGKQSESDEMIFKLAQLNSLSVYWNADSPPTTNFDFFWESSMKNAVAKEQRRPPNVQYLFGPVSASARVQLNTVPGAAMRVPAVRVDLGVDSLSVSLDKLQYDGVLSLLDSLDRMVVQRRFLMYRPFSPASTLAGGDGLEWFRYAGNAVRSIIHKRQVVWSWSHIRGIRQDFKAYQAAYRKKLQAKKPSAELLQELQVLEKRMIVFNIVTARSRAEAEVRRSSSSSAKSSGSSSWLGWMWSSPSSSSALTPSTPGVQPPSEEELKEEKDKLLEAIGYSEGLSGKRRFPIQYEAYVGVFELSEVELCLRSAGGQVARLLAREACVSLRGRPSATALQVSMQLGSLTVTGAMATDMPRPPDVITSNLGEWSEKGKPLLSIDFELHPLPDGRSGPNIDQKISVELMPVQVLYDADSVDAVISMLEIPPDTRLHRLSSVAQTTLKDIRSQTRAGLEHALTNRTILDVDLTLHAPYLLVPYRGSYTSGCDVVVVDLGSLHVSSDWSKYLSGDAQIRTATVGQLEDSFYDNFTLNLKNVQVLIGKDGEWEKVRQSGQTSPLHLLNPTLFNFTLKKSLIFNDPQRPNIVVSGTLPELEVEVSDRKIISLVQLLKSLPLPPPSLRNRPAQAYSRGFSTREDVLSELTRQPSFDDGMPDLSGALSRDSAGGVASPSGSLSAEITPGDISEDEYDSCDEYETASECSSEEEGERRRPFTPPLMPASQPVEDPADEVPVFSESVVPVPVLITASSSPEERARIVQARLGLTINKVVVGMCVHRPGVGEVPRLTLEVVGMKLSIEKTTYHLTAEATVGQLSAVDFLVQDGDSNKLLWSQFDNLLTAKYLQVDVDHPHFHSKFDATQKLIDASVGEIGVGIWCSSLGDMLALTNRILKGIRSHPAPSPLPHRPVSPLQEAVERDVGEVVGKNTVIVEAERSTGLKVVSRFGGLSVYLWDREVNLLLAEVKDLKATITMTTHLILVEASLGGLCVKDPVAEVYSDVLQQVDPSEDFISVEFRKFSPPVEPPPVNPTRPDMAVLARLKELRVVVLFQFLKRLQLFVRRLRVDQRMLNSAKEVASSAAARTMETFQEHSSAKISLDVVIQAPVVGLPLSVSSRETFEVKLGLLHINNRFCLFPPPLPPATPTVSQPATPPALGADSCPLYEVMTVVLEEASFYRVVRGEETDAIRPLLSPVSIETVVKRSLSPWYQSHDLPQLASVDLRLKKTMLGIADDDLVRVLHLLAGNLGDLSRDDDAKPSRHPSDAQDTIAEEDEDEDDDDEDEDDDDEEDDEEELESEAENSSPLLQPATIPADTSTTETTDSASRPQLALTAVIDNVGIVVYRSGRSLDVSARSSWCHQDSDELMSFALTDLSTRLLQGPAPSSVDVRLCVGGCVVRDCRSGQQSRVEEFLRKSSPPVPGQEQRPFLEVHYSLTQPSPSRQRQQVEVQLPCAEVTVDLQFLYSLQDFARELLTAHSSLTRNLPPLPPPSAGQRTASLGSVPLSPQPAAGTAVDTPVRPSVPPKQPAPAPAAPAAAIAEREFSLRVQVSSPRIGVIAAPPGKEMLLLTGDICLRVSTRAGLQEHSTRVYVNMNDFSVSSAGLPSLSPAPYKGSKILRKADFSLSYSSPSSCGKDVLILLDSYEDIHFILSPSDVRLLLAVLKSVERVKKGTEELEDTPADLWELKPLDFSAWYLQDEEDDLPHLVAKAVLTPSGKLQSEEVVVNLKTITVTLNHETTEAETGGPAFKMVATKAYGSVRNWSSSVGGGAGLELRAAFFNTRFNVWEYVLEPSSVEAGQSNYWTLNTEINSAKDRMSVEGSRLAPRFLCSIFSKESLQLTLSRTSIGDLLNLIDEYAKPVKSVAPAVCGGQEEPVHTDEPTYRLKNKLGLKITVLAKDSLAQEKDQSKAVVLDDGQEAVYVSKATVAEDLSSGLLKQEVKHQMWSVCIEGFLPRRILVTGYSKNYYPLRPIKESSEMYGVIVEAEPYAQNVTMVTIRSPVQVLNNTEEPCLVAVVMGTHLTSDAVAKEEVVKAGEKRPLPLGVAHTGQVFVKFQNKHTNYPSSGVRWSEEDKVHLECLPGDGAPKGTTPHYIRAVVVKESDIAKARLVPNMADRAHHIITLNYPIIVHNSLPYKAAISSSLVARQELAKGQSLPLTSCALVQEEGHFRNLLHLSKQPKVHLTLTVNMEGGQWNGSMVLEPQEDKIAVFTVQKDKNERTLAVNLEDRGSWRVTVFAPYWMVNKTALTLDYTVAAGLSFGSKAECIVSQSPGQRIVLLKHDDELFKRSTDLKVRLGKTPSSEPSGWSKAFSLDTVGFCGVIKLDHNGTTYHFGVEVTLSRQGLTKMITLTPFFLFENLTKYTIKCFNPADDNPLPSFSINPKQLVPYHPSLSQDSVQICLGRVALRSLPFKFSVPGTMLVRTPRGETPAVVAQIKATSHATLVTLSPYYPGAAPFLVVNDLKELTLEFKQNIKKEKGARNVHIVLPGHSYLYTWDQPQEGKELRVWVRGREKHTYLIKPQDASGKFKLPRGFKKMLVLDRAARAMRSHGGSRRMGSLATPLATPSPMVSEHESSGVEEMDGAAETGHDRWMQYDPEGGSSEDEAEDSDLEGLEDIDSPPPSARKMRGKLKKLFSFGRSSQDLDQSLVDRLKGRWISFMDGIQRVLLFTLDKACIERAQRGQLIQPPDLAVWASMESVGLSLVNDIIGKEVSYIGIAPCPVVWEWEKRPGYWRSMVTSATVDLEQAFQAHALACTAAGTSSSSPSPSPSPSSSPSSSVELTLQEEKWKVVFGDVIVMSKVASAEEHQLRRSSFPGISLRFTSSASQLTLRASVHSLQVDNQLSKVMFPQVLYSIPPPPSIASSIEPKPLFDASLIIRKAGRGAMEYKLIQVVLQKIGVSLELGFILALSKLFGGWRRPPDKQADVIAKDLQHVDASLKDTLLPALAATEKSFVDNIMFSPVHIVLSISLSQSSSSEEMRDEESVGMLGSFDVFSTIFSFLKSVGAFVVDIKDSDLKLNRLDASQLVLSRPELVHLVKEHYTQQVLRQIYKAVFNLNVIGNPVSLVGGVASGVTDLFYEPYKAVTLGPEEFVEALGIGMHSALGGTVGGALGVVGTFTGKLGDAAALFSRDKKEREKRQSEKRELSITYGFGSLIKDFGGAVTNVVVQPVKGAHKEGIIGFLKGTGRGIFGLALRPLGGALDLTTIAVERLKRVTKIDDYELEQLRLPRYIGPDQVIRPYSLFAATGKAFLEEIEPSPSEDLFYLTHFVIDPDLDKAFLITNRFAVLFSQARKIDILKKWDRDKEIYYDTLAGRAQSKDNTFTVKVKKDSRLSKLFSKESTEDVTVELRTSQDAQESSRAFNQAVADYNVGI